MTLNSSAVSGFLPQGFSISAEEQIWLFALLLPLYLVILVGNFFIILVILLDATLHKSVYFFLGSLSALELVSSSVTIPKTLVSLLLSSKCISLMACAAQRYLFLSLGSTESALLTTVTYDWYVAICHPMRYPSLMNKRMYILLAVTSWTIAIPAQILQTALLFCLPFCSSNKINHAKGRRKAFSACSSHFTVLALFYVSAFINYVQPKSKTPPDKLLSLFYTVFPAMLNPFLYSLRNRVIQAALEKVLWRKTIHGISRAISGICIPALHGEQFIPKEDTDLKQKQDTLSEGNRGTPGDAGDQTQDLLHAKQALFH
ncbi:olfactory receptor 10A2-like [Struthio camelus]|uniref:olfactory receptor 10A2-like n=1 Tax=Struthio camelus TaxID=8801 RepID=UPI003603CAAD